MSHVFISYVRDDARRVDEFARALKEAGVDVWLDREQISPGQRWREAIRQAIRSGTLFVACFSRASALRETSYMNEELVEAIDELRLRSTDRGWFVSVLMDDGEVPPRSIGGGETLHDLQWVDLSSDRSGGIARVVSAAKQSAERARRDREEEKRARELPTTDGFDRALGADLEWHEVGVLRAYARYAKQAGVNLSETFIQQTLAKYPAITKLIIAFFHNYLDPALTTAATQAAESGPGRGMGRKAAALGIRTQIEDALEAVWNPDEDRLFRLYMSLVNATLRTNYFQNDAQGNRKRYLSFKLDSRAVSELPDPRPMSEIFVYAPWMEGIYLRGGKVARGGIRWSDRGEEFRAETLALMARQMVKNVVIVPVGAKGGFVVKNPSTDRAKFAQEGIDSYKTLLRGILDITDNLRGSEIIPPREVVRRDEDDPYLVVATDKGTARFSDIANGISAKYGFWLGDAFAPGGSDGYDHKAIGITARGGWESVKRHFRELGQDTQSEDFTVVGIGDMSGDVFGNAMLLSKHLKLIGAFNHSHILVDPDPDPAASFAERKRMFDGALNWSSYDTRLLSPGGGVYERRARTISVSEQAQRLFDLPKRAVTPVELMKAILRAPADLLWLGGIGTYVKASWENPSEAWDRLNDAVRVDANELRVRVVGEGANLGFTQHARIEFSLLGGRINTDAIDNSAGVDLSDHEVNIKLALYNAIEHRELSGIEERNALMAEMTEDVARLVLRDNYEQTQAISIAQNQGETFLDEQARFMRALEKAGKLYRPAEALPDDETIAERHAAHIGLTRPEVAVLLAYSKLALYEDVLKSGLPEDPALVEDLVYYFPGLLQERYRGAIERHPLRREIIATALTNGMINRMRPSFPWAACDEVEKKPSDVARAFVIVRESFGLREVWSAIESLDNALPAPVQIHMMTSVQRFLERAILWLLRHGDEQLGIAAWVSDLRPPIHRIQLNLDGLLPQPVLNHLRVLADELQWDGIPKDLAWRLASLGVMASVLDIVRIVRLDATRGVEDIARVYFGVGSRFGFDRLHSLSANMPAETSWQKIAIAALVEDLFNFQSVLTTRVIAESDGTGLDAWLASRGRAVQRVDRIINDVGSAAAVDLAMLSVTIRQLRALAES